MVDSFIRLRSLSGDTVGNTWAASGTMLVGRTPGLQMFLEDNSISRWHAELALASGGWIVQDMGSRNGTCLNGQLVGAEGHKVQSGDVLQFGNISVMVETAYVHIEKSSLDREKYQVEKSILLHWNDLPQLEAQLSDNFPKGFLTLLMRTGRNFKNMKTIKDCLKAILWESAEFFAAEHAAVLTVGEDANPLALRESLDLGPVLQPKWFLEHPLVSETFVTGKSLLGRDDNGRTVLSVLLRTGNENRMGVLLLVRNDRDQRFQEHDLILADSLALGMSLSLETFLQTYHRYQGACSSIFDILTKISQWQNPGVREQQQRITQVALLLAAEFGLPERDRNCLRLAIPLRNLGVLGLRQDLLDKKGGLSAEEKAQIRKNIVMGVETLEEAPWMSSLTPIIRYCRERWDGSGYPDGQKGEAIPLLARIVALADALAAMMEERPYRKSRSLDAAIAEIRAHQGTQFDPACVDALVRIRPKLESAVVSHHHLLQTMSHDEFRKAVALCQPQPVGPGRPVETREGPSFMDQQAQA